MVQFCLTVFLLSAALLVDLELIVLVQRSLGDRWTGLHMKTREGGNLDVEVILFEGSGPDDTRTRDWLAKGTADANFLGGIVGLTCRGLGLGGHGTTTFLLGGERGGDVAFIVGIVGLALQVGGVGLLLLVFDVGYRWQFKRRTKIR